MQNNEIVKRQSYDVQISVFNNNIELEDVFPAQIVPSGLPGYYNQC